MRGEEEGGGAELRSWDRQEVDIGGLKETREGGKGAGSKEREDGICISSRMDVWAVARWTRVANELTSTRLRTD